MLHMSQGGCALHERRVSAHLLNCLQGKSKGTSARLPIALVVQYSWVDYWQLTIRWLDCLLIPLEGASSCLPVSNTQCDSIVPNCQGTIRTYWYSSLGQMFIAFISSAHHKVEKDASASSDQRKDGTGALRDIQDILHWSTNHSRRVA